MPIQTRAELIDALRVCRLFSDEQFAELLREFATIGGDLKSAMRHLVETGRATVYQLRKVLHGKSDELIVGDYIIRDKLGEGGMGKVYRARHVRIGREVALKLIRPNLLANPIIRGRYEREVKSASALRHPNIVAVEDAGETDGKTWLALEFVDGVDLARLVRDHGVVGVPEACEYIRQAALGLQHAHALGFVHRDIKPSNIIVSGERHIPNARGPAQVKILDMGLVRGGFEDDEPGLDLTRAGTVVGTPDYMAPEQARNSSTVDHRADLYALGCSFYLLLTGKPPYPTGSAIEKLLKHQTEPPRPLQAERPDVPDELAAVVAKLMAKKPDDRFASATAVADALLPFTGITATPGPTSRPVDESPAALTSETLEPSELTVPMAEPVDAAPQAGPASPFDFPVEYTRPESPKSTRTLRSASVAAARPSRMWLGLGLVGVALVAGVIVVAASSRNSGAKQSAPSPEAKTSSPPTKAEKK